MSNLSTAVDRLIARQLDSWEPARKNYGRLKNIETKTLDFGAFGMQVQFNPDRARSTTAPVEQMRTRPCFLCEKNRPAAQEKIDWENYEILVNPYPIFPLHLTIPDRNHTPQHITGRFLDMMRLAEQLPRFEITFNGAQSGASAPDHFHFQAVGKGSLRVEKEIPTWKNRNWLGSGIWAAEEYLRPAIVIEGIGTEKTAETAEQVMRALSGPEEAQFNVLAWSEAGLYRIVLFPRTAHRPAQYYAEGRDQVLFSPGAVDLAGVLITVRPEDFNRMDTALVKDLLSQVVPDKAHWETLKTTLRDLMMK